MRFRGCDGDFERGLEAVRADPDGFGGFVNDFVGQMKKRKVEIEANAEGFLEKYGIKYCPSHSGALVSDVRPNSIVLGVDNDLYSFDSVVCSAWKRCRTPISFDEGLIGKLSKSIILELKPESNNGCTTCQSNKGQIYLVGFRSPIESDTALQKERKFSNDSPIYLFERPCSHNYVAIGSGAAPNLKRKK